MDYDAFDIPWKNAPTERLRRWKKAALVLNASSRYKYTLDLEKEDEKEQIRRKIRAHAQAVRSAFLFKDAAESMAPGTPSTTQPSGGYGIGVEKLTSMTRDHDSSALQQYGGVKGLASMLKTNLEKGIIEPDDTELLRRRNAFGANTYPQNKGRSFFVFLWEACQDLTLIILIVAAVISLVLGIKTEGVKEGWYDGGSIAFAVILVIVVTVISDYKQYLQFQSLNEEKRNILFEVIRGGRIVEISIFDIVVGDVVPLKIGDKVPADGILISGHSLAVDESSMTGESKIVHKDLKSPFFISGCQVADGYGIMLVTAVGINTECGLLMASISEDSGEETPLQVRLNGVANLIGKVGISVASLVLVVLIARFFTGHTKNPDGTVQFVKGHTSVKDAIIGAVKILTVAVTIVVIALPEDLPLAVTLTLAYSMRNIMAANALVRRLPACETMGCATTICCNKTGTLTLNRMTVVEAHVGGIKLSSPDDGQELSSSVSSMLFESIVQNTTGNVYEPEDGGPVDVTGSPTEKAILSWAVKLGMKFDETRSKTSILHVFPFNLEKKHGGVAVHVEGSEVHVHWMGAAEIVLSSCTNWLDSNSQLQEMTPNQMDAFKLCIEDMAAGNLRCVAIAYRLYEMENVPEEEKRDGWALPESDLILLGIVGIEDPCRPGVRDVVELCTNAGVKVRLVTGDNIQAAKAIALECGILNSELEPMEPTIIEGQVFRSYSEETREQIAEKISVMGRSSPNDKLLLVQALRKKDHVVAVIGNDINDAPALHEADIGISMGIQSTEVAKESSDIIILDDNFASVVKVVRWGRSVYANIQKFIQFRLTCNVVVLVINVLSAVSSGEVLLNTVELLHLGFLISGRRFSVCMSHAFAVIVFQVLSVKRHERIRCFDNNQCQQLLWVNLIMDTLGAFALATEPPTDQLMMRPPVGRREPLVTNIMWRNLFVQVLYQGTILVVLNFGGKSLLRLNNETREHANKVINTFIFNTFVFCQLSNKFNARKPDELNVFKGVTKNRLFMGMIGITLLLQILIIEFLGKFFSIVRLNWQLWMVSVGIAFISWPLAIAGKMIPVPKTPFGEYCRSCFWKQPSRECQQQGKGQGGDASSHC